MQIRRVMPHVQSQDRDRSRELYVDVLGLEEVMDMGHVVTFASTSNPTAQISVVTSDPSSQPVPDITVEVEDVDRVHADAVRSGVPVVYPLTDEAWGVRRCFLLDPDGTVVNVMQHQPP